MGSKVIASELGGTRMIELLIVLGIAAALLVWAITIYNRLVSHRNHVREGWSGIDVQLKRRADLLPNLIETVKGYLQHERELLTKVTELRARTLAAGDGPERRQAEGLLGAAIGNLIAVAENYPELKADANFRALQGSLAETEEQIQLARRYYNGVVRNLNILIESFPSNLVAGAFGFRPAEYFEIEDAADRAVPKVSFS